jgi:hypothetical protein
MHIEVSIAAAAEYAKPSERSNSVNVATEKAVKTMIVIHAWRRFTAWAATAYRLPSPAIDMNEP